MDDIKKRKSNISAQSLQNKEPAIEPDLSFLEEEEVDDPQSIVQPSRILNKFNKFLPKRTLFETVAAIILLLGGIYIGSQFMGQKQSNLVNLKTESDSKSEETQNNNIKVAGESDQLFEQNAYYKVELFDGEVYYGLITDYTNEHYKLNNVFYTINEINQATPTTERITLAMYGASADKPAGEILLSRMHVKSASVLSENSPIVSAIHSYLAKIESESGENPNNQ